MVFGETNDINTPLVQREEIVLSKLNINLGLMKQFVKVFNNDGSCFKYVAA